MNIIVKDSVLDSYSLTKSQFLYLLSLSDKITDTEQEDLRLNRFFITDYAPNPPVLTQHGIKIVNRIILESESLTESHKDNLTILAETLQELFPEGKKEGTKDYWRANTAEIRERLQTFFKKFGKYPNDVVIDATKRYIEDSKNNITLMRLLKYFIHKKTADGITSDLLSYIENKGTTNESTEWSELR